MIIPTLRIGEKNLYDEVIEDFLKKGISTIRVNMTRYSLERYCEDINHIREKSNHAFEIMADIPVPGKKYRTSILEEEKVISKGQKMIFTTRNQREEGCLAVEIDRFVSFDGIEKGILGDGELSFSAKYINENRIAAVADNDSVVRGGRSFIIANTLPYELCTEEEWEIYLDALRKIQPEKIVLSFSEDLEVLENLCKRIKSELPHSLIVPKIETQKGVDGIEEIFDRFEEVMLGRGDLALFSDIKKFGENQCKVLNAAKKKNKNVIVATDILTSLYESKIPARGELSDLFYLQTMGVKDIVASAGISVQRPLFDRFYELSEKFLD